MEEDFGHPMATSTPSPSYQFTPSQLRDSESLFPPSSESKNVLSKLNIQKIILNAICTVYS